MTASQLISVSPDELRFRCTSLSLSLNLTKCCLILPLINLNHQIYSNFAPNINYYKHRIRYLVTIVIFVWSVELEKQTFCDLKVLNNTQNHVAFKVFSFNLMFPNILLLPSHCILFPCTFLHFLFHRSKPLLRRSTLYDQTPVSYTPGTPVSSEVLLVNITALLIRLVLYYMICIIFIWVRNTRSELKNGNW